MQRFGSAECKDVGTAGKLREEELRRIFTPEHMRPLTVGYSVSGGVIGVVTLRVRNRRARDSSSDLGIRPWCGACWNGGVIMLCAAID